MPLADETVPVAAALPLVDPASPLAPDAPAPGALEVPEPPVFPEPPTAGLPPLEHAASRAADRTPQGRAQVAMGAFYHLSRIRTVNPKIGRSREGNTVS
jgi:hypothetical protein